LADQRLAFAYQGSLTAANNADLFSHIERHFSTALLSDALDEMGVRDRAMREHLRPLEPNTVLTGRARTILCMDVYHIQENPYAKEIEAVNSILPGEVVVVVTAESKRSAPWGELLSTAAAPRASIRWSL